jgi:hypothetical protein
LDVQQKWQEQSTEDRHVRNHNLSRRRLNGRIHLLHIGKKRGNEHGGKEQGNKLEEQEQKGILWKPMTASTDCDEPRTDWAFGHGGHKDPEEEERIAGIVDDGQMEQLVV